MKLIDIQPGHNFDYRFGFQGKESDKEKDPNNNFYAYKYPHYDADIGRWLSPDPYGQYWSPYLGMGNLPILFVDPDGGKGKRGQFMDLMSSLGFSREYSKSLWKSEKHTIKNEGEFIVRQELGSDIAFGIYEMSFDPIMDVGNILNKAIVGGGAIVKFSPYGGISCAALTYLTVKHIDLTSVNASATTTYAYHKEYSESHELFLGNSVYSPNTANYSTESIDGEYLSTDILSSGVQYGATFLIGGNSSKLTNRAYVGPSRGLTLSISMNGVSTSYGISHSKVIKDLGGGHALRVHRGYGLGLGGMNNGTYGLSLAGGNFKSTYNGR